MTKTYLYLSIAICSLSLAGPLIRLCDSNPFLIAFYRMFFAMLVLLPLSLPHLKRILPTLSLKNYGRILLMAIFFSAHLIFWIISLSHTKVANAMIAFSLNPVFTAIAAFFFLKEKIDRYVIIALFLGLAGLVVLGYEDLSLAQNYFYGDMLAALGGAFFAAYFVIGRPLRQLPELNNFALMSMIYFIGSLLALIFIFFYDVPLFTLSQQSMLAIAALVFFPTILGHVGLAYVLKYLPASMVSASTLVEPVLGGIVAYNLFHEDYSYKVWIGYALIVAGLLFLIYSENKRKN
ncbi:MAG: DMT family transporter [Oligoflexia bacterium]|nr:DMT family transporter [Oligoflexia bacterium]